MNKNVWLYIGTNSRTLMIPASRLRGMHPSDDGKLLLSFNSIVNTINSPTDKVILNLFENNTHLDVMKSITRAINNNTPTFSGFINVADTSASTLDVGTGSIVLQSPSFLTDDDTTEGGKIASIDSLIIQDISLGSLTATTAASWSDGTATPRTGFWTITSDNAAKVIHLPAVFQGARVEYITSGSGFKLRTKTSTEYINNTNGEVSTDISSSSVRITCVGISNTKWLVNVYSADGSFDNSGDEGSFNPVTNGEDLNLTANSASINLTATEDTASAILLSATTGGVTIQSLDGGAGPSDVSVVSSGGSVNIQSTEDIANSIAIQSFNGGIDIEALGAAAGEDIDITATGSSINLTSTESVANAIVLNASGANGGIDITANASIDIAGETVTIANRKDELATLSTITDSSITAVSGIEYIVNDTNGGAMVLPNCTPGQRITLIIGVNLVSNLTITAQAGDLLKGYAIMQDIDAGASPAKTLFAPDGTNDLIITLNGSTTGGLVGDKIELIGISDTEWRVRAALSHTAAAATPFS